MRHTLSVLAMLLLLGCSVQEGLSSEEESTKVPDPVAQESGSGGSVQPLTTGGAGAATPVTGAESVGGGDGYSVGSVAKDRARRAAVDSSATTATNEASGE